MSGYRHIRGLPPPLFVTSPQLPSPRTSIQWKHLAYCLLLNSRFRTADLHPTSSLPCWAYHCSRVGVDPFLKWMLARANRFGMPAPPPAKRSPNHKSQVKNPCICPEARNVADEIELFGALAIRDGCGPWITRGGASDGRTSQWPGVCFTLAAPANVAAR